MTNETVARWALAAFLLVAGVGHVVSVDAFLAQVPSWLPARTAIVIGSGLVEVAFAVALVSGRATRQVGWALAAFFVVVWVGNVNQAVVGSDAFGLDTDTSRWLRVALQPLLVAWALWCTHAWPGR